MKRSLLALLLLAPGPFVPAQGFSDPSADPAQSVARVSYLDGDVSYARGDDPDQWQGIDQNVPMATGDRVYTGGGKTELQLESGAAIRLGSGTDFTALNLTDDTSQFAVNAGVSFFSIPRLEEGELFEVDTPNAAVTLERAGRYRVDVDEAGATRVTVRQGRATIAAGGGQLALSDGESLVIDGIDTPRYEVVAPLGPDRWDAWVDGRELRATRATSVAYVSPGVVGVADLDEYGSWESLPEYGRVWRPRSVDPGWAPYRVGRWYWQDPWGWTWVSSEPWGWAPYHYGRWVLAASQWYWVPAAPAVRVRYAPALVAFVGASPSAGASVSFGPGMIGWFPLAPRDPLVPWWGRGRAVNVTNVTNVTYVNRTEVTVVNQSTFVSGALVSSAIVREQSTVRQAAQAPVVTGPVPVTPTVSSTRGSVRRDAPVSRPSQAVAARPVVTRAAPPPAPPRFEQKVAMIRDNRGAPVTPETSSRAASAAPMQRPVIPVRPAASPGGNVTLQPRAGSQLAEKRVEPVHPAPASPARPSANPVQQPRPPQPQEPAPPVARPDDASRRPPAAAPQPEQRVAPEQRPDDTRRPAAVPQTEQRVAPEQRLKEKEQDAPTAYRAPTPRPNHRPVPTVARPSAPQSPARDEADHTAASARPATQEPPSRPEARPHANARPTPASEGKSKQKPVTPRQPEKPAPRPTPAPD